MEFGIDCCGEQLFCFVQIIKTVIITKINLDQSCAFAIFHVFSWIGWGTTKSSCQHQNTPFIHQYTYTYMCNRTDSDSNILTTVEKADRGWLCWGWLLYIRGVSWRLENISVYIWFQRSSQGPELINSTISTTKWEDSSPIRKKGNSVIETDIFSMQT